MQQKKLRIHEDPNGSIYIAGVTSQRVESEEEVSTRTLKKNCLICHVNYVHFGTVHVQVYTFLKLPK